MKKILIVNICKEKLHYYEFVKPIEEILRINGFNYFIRNYEDIKNNDLRKCSKIIICGTSLFDNYFIKDIKTFKWLLGFEKPVLGICGGMQIIGLIFGGKLKKKKEIGFYNENFIKNFLGFFGEKEVYHLHNYYVGFNNMTDFEVFSESKVSQAVKHKSKNIYGVLFHPEVRNVEVIINFVK
jgi:GMP synthase (glutamine-hydrolysing)